MVGGFYSRLRDRRGDDDAFAACIERVINQLKGVATSEGRPGILLGKIQSGKTRGFVGVIARSFDREIDIAIVLTKGTKTLSAQTVARLEADFSEFIEEDELIVLDIMKLPGKLRKSELKRKIVIVAKKQGKNLERLIAFITENKIEKRKVLLIDDEADLASVRFVKKKGKDDIEQGAIAEYMDELRRMVDRIEFLQVTATPYSLYLQPEGYEENSTNYVFKPKKPAFTELLPIHAGYVGGDDYFGSFDDADPRKRLYVEVSRDEHDALRRADMRRIRQDRILDNPNIAGLQRAIVTFILAVCIRRWQQHEAGERKCKYAMIIHNDTQKSAHRWQEQVIEWIIEAIVKAAESTPSLLRPIFDSAYDDINQSVAADRGNMPKRVEAFNAFIDALQSDDVVREKVNSDSDVMALLDANAELKLRTPYNIFVGGNILDRGITIPNLISFYYGRNPKLMQADTVLQHSRMYGNRDRRDLAVTRFFTSQDVYDRLYAINDFENALRGAFEKGAHDKGVVFIQTDRGNGIRPCAPNKILLSDIVTVEPNGLFLPTGFNTKSATEMLGAQAKLGRLIKEEWRDKEEFVTVEKELAFSIIDEIASTLVFEDAPFQWAAMKSLIDYYLSRQSKKDDNMLLLTRTGRKLDRKRSGDKSGLSILGGGSTRVRVLEDGTRSKPALVLLQQIGSKELNWRGASFWWPILAAPANAEPCVFAAKLRSD